MRLLPDFCGCPLLYGKAFSLVLDVQGKVEAVAALASSVEALPA